MTTTTIERAALELPEMARAGLAEKLLASLPAGDSACAEARAEHAWLTEASRRAAEIDAGEVELIPGEEAERQIRAMLD